MSCGGWCKRVETMQRATRSNRSAPAYTVFFLLSCVQAALAVPLWWAESQGWIAACAECSPSLRHAHEMLLGYAVAVIGGFLFTRLSWSGLILAVAAWLAGRAIAMADATGPVAAMTALAYPAVLAVLAGMPFLKAARSGRNLAFAPILAGFMLAEALYQAGRLGLLAQGEARGVWLAFDLVAAMLLVMGGRLIPAAMSGILRARGDAMADRNGPRLELVVLAAMAGAALCHVADVAMLGALGWVVAGAAGLVRLTRWRFGASLAVASLWPLQMGYGWLVAGLIASGCAAWSGWWPVTATLHAITIGGLGVITATMMVRTVMLRERISACFPRMALVAVGLLLLGATARIITPLSPPVLMAIAALAWSGAFLLVGGSLAILVIHAKAQK